MKTLNPKILKFLSARYPEVSAVGLESMWISAVAWAESSMGNSHAKHDLHPAVEVAALFRVHAICARNDAERKAAYMFCAVETLSPYQN